MNREAMPDDKAHWNRVYASRSSENMSWFQPSLRLSLSLVERSGILRTDRIIDVGGGASTFVDDLLAAGFENITVLDISSEALALSKQRLGSHAERVTWIEADVTDMDLGEGAYDFWHDRAVFHFLTQPSARRAYVRAAERAIAPGGHIVVAAVGPGGPKQCSGLDIVQYDADKLHAELGPSFQRVESLKEQHRTPSGTEQPFIYSHCRRRR